MEIIGAIIVAIVITLIFFYALSARGPWGTLWSFFLIILLIVWASSLWIAPTGYVYWGVDWIPLLFIGVLIALLLTAIPPSRDNYYRGVKGDVVGDDVVEDDVVERDVIKPKKEEAEAVSAIGIMFWIFVVLMVIAVMAGYATDTRMNLP
ncbi:MAG: hypothetical protein WD426_07815 [Anditalea sp.]